MANDESQGMPSASSATPVAAVAAPHSPAARDMLTFCRDLLDNPPMDPTLRVNQQEWRCEIDVGSRWEAEQLVRASGEKWKLQEQRDRQLPGGEIAPIGYSFEVMIREQYLLQRTKTGEYLCVRRRRGVLSPMAIAEDVG